MKRKKDWKTLLSIVMLGFVFVIWVYILFMPEISIAANGAAVNQTLNTTVNVTNSAPEVRSVVCPSTVDLDAYGNTTVLCNVTVYDYDNNTAKVNATFYYYLNRTDQPNDKNTHYTNVTCSNDTQQDFYMNFTCGFNVAYFTNNGTWYSNVTAEDVGTATGDNRSSSLRINPLIALYIPDNTVLNYGEMNYNDISTDKLANVTNAGNIRVNVSIQGWGTTRGDNLSMVCSYGSIPIGYQKYHINPNQNYETVMLGLNSTNTLIRNWNINKTTNENSPSMNTTYWKLKIPTGVGGICQGKVMFTASLY
ncbi:MAG: hypothetical protein V1859_10615 [archaeon]